MSRRQRASALLMLGCAFSMLVATLPAAAAPSTSVPVGQETPVGPTVPVEPKPIEMPEPGYFRTDSPNYGVSVFLDGRADALSVLQGARLAGFTWQKSLVRWRDVELAKGDFEWNQTDALVRATEDADMRLIVRTDFQPAWARLDGANNGPPDNYQDYADFVGALVKRYKKGGQRGRIHAIEVWNEPNLSREWGGQPISQATAVQYVQLLCAAYQAAKLADPYVTVVSAGLSPTGIADGTAQPDDQYLQWMYDAGAKGCYDVLGAHAPGYKAAPSVSPEEAALSPELGGHRSFTFRRVEDLRNIMVLNGDLEKQVWILEFGWTSDSENPTYAWHAVTEEQKAQYLVEAYQWAIANWQPWIGLMATWNMADSDWTAINEEYWWSITNPDGSPRPALTAFATARTTGILPGYEPPPAPEVSIPGPDEALAPAPANTP